MLKDKIVVSRAQLQALYKQASIPMQPRLPQQPSYSDVPMRWAQTYMGPGMPLSPVVNMGQVYPSYRQDPSREPKNQSRIVSANPKQREDGTTVYTVETDTGFNFETQVPFTPRSFQYPPNVNTTITPRVSYSNLMSFADIQALSWTTSDVMLCPRLLKREFMNLSPRILHADGSTCDDPRINRLVNYPDGFNSMSTWLGRWYYNGVLYDSPALHMVRDHDGYIKALVNVDGSTIFLLIDENGNPPAPPAPAYLQIIWGSPYGFLSTEQLWYRPNDLQINSNYGTALVEAANLPAILLNNIWKYQAAWFQAGNMPEAIYVAPMGWTNDQVVDWLLRKNEALAGNPDLRSQFDVWPYGFTALIVKEVAFRKEIYDLAKREVMSHAGLPVSEIGETPRGGLGGRGFMETMGQSLFRQAFLPWMKATAAPFDDALRINAQDVEANEYSPARPGYVCTQKQKDHHIEWQFPPQSIDPEKEAQKITDQFHNGEITLGQAAEAHRLPEPPEKLKNARLLPKGSVLIDEEGHVIASAAEVPPELQAPAGKPYPAAVAPGNANANADEAKPGEAKPAPAPASADNAKPDENKTQTGDPKEPPAAKALGLDNGARALSKAADHDGVMVALPIREDVTRQLLRAAYDGGVPVAAFEREDHFHVTLAYLGDVPTAQGSTSRDALGALVKAFAATHRPLTGKFGGIAKFPATDDGTIPLVALFDCPELASFQGELVRLLEASGAVVDHAHGFTAHVTIAYLPKELADVHVECQPIDTTITELVLAWGGQWQFEALRSVSMNKNLAKLCGACGLTLAKHCGVCQGDDAYYGGTITRELTVPMPHQGANDSEIVSVSKDGLEPKAFVWKPEGGEQPDLAITMGHPQYPVPEAVYLVDRALGLYLVPVSFVGEVDGERGSASYYVSNAPPAKPLGDYDPKWVQRAAVLDWVTGQADQSHEPERTNSNYLTHPDDPMRPVPYDTALAFPTSTAKRPLSSQFVDAWRGKPIDADLLDALNVLKDHLTVWQRVANLVGDDARDQALKRLDTLLALGQVPLESQEPQTRVGSDSGTGDSG